MKKAWFLIAPVSLIFFSCATQVAPSGGALDTIPPAVLKEVPESFSTDFRSKDIAITFDEYVHLDNLNEQLVISPPLSAMPEVKIKGKTLLIHLDDTLQDNKTYTFNFGSSIKDITENNVIENFQYVFSTGAAVDTEQVNGKVFDAFTREPVKGVLVMLYDTPADSLPYLVKPSYFSRTGEDGGFLIKNISGGDYKIFALRETNNNYLFDSRDENIAFIHHPVTSGSDSLNLFLFTEKLPQQLKRAAAIEPGQVMLVFQQPADSLKYELLSADPGIFAEEYSASKDTVNIWYKNTAADSLIFKIISPQSLSGDTVIVRLISSEKLKSAQGKATSGRGINTFRLSTQTNLSGKFDLNDSIRITFSHPIESWDSVQVMLLKDSAEKISAAIKFTDVLKRNMYVAAPWKENTTYALKIPHGTFTDVFGLKNDTLELSFRTQQLNEYGTVKLDVNLHDTLENNVHLILQLLDENGKVARQNFLSKSRAVYYEYLTPAIYRLRMIVDENNNRQWDTGNYLKNMQPETVIYNSQKINVRANWDIEMEWNLPEDR